MLSVRAGGAAHHGPLAEVRCGDEPVCRNLGQRNLKDVNYVRWDARAHYFDRRHPLLYVPRNDRLRRPARERRLAHEHLIQHTT